MWSYIIRFYFYWLKLSYSKCQPKYFMVIGKSNQSGVPTMTYLTKVTGGSGSELIRPYDFWIINYDGYRDMGSSAQKSHCPMELSVDDIVFNVLFIIIGLLFFWSLKASLAGKSNWVISDLSIFGYKDVSLAVIL